MPITSGLNWAFGASLLSFTVLAVIFVVTGKLSHKPSAPSSGGACPTGSTGCCTRCSPNLTVIGIVSLAVAMIVFFVIWGWNQRKLIMATL